LINSLTIIFFDEIQLYPDVLTWVKFVLALGIGEEIISKLKNSWKKKESVDEFIHQQMMKLFQLYIIVGGMPAVVQKYVDTNLQAKNKVKLIFFLRTTPL